MADEKMETLNGKFLLPESDDGQAGVHRASPSK